LYFIESVVTCPEMLALLIHLKHGWISSGRTN